jgi:hypothetical protein
LTDSRQLGTKITEPKNLNRWTVFCTNNDHDGAKSIENEFYKYAGDNKLGINVEFAEVVTVQKTSVQEF